MAQKPAEIVYGVDEKVPWSLALGMGAQHCVTMATTLVLAVLVVEEMGGTNEVANAFVRLTMVAAGLGTILQSLRRGPVGAGYLCPMTSATAIFPATILAVKTGGLSLVFGMTIVAGVFQGLLSLVVHRLRPFLPPEITGVIVAMIGITLVPVGISGLFGLSVLDLASEPREFALGLVSLTVLFGLSIWGGRVLRLYAIIGSLVAGYLLGAVLGIVTSEDLVSLSAVPVVALPRPHWPGDLKFDVALVLPFLVAGLGLTLITVGGVSTAQKINDETWVQPDMTSVRGGVLAHALAQIGAGLLGGMGLGVYPANIGLSLATGVTSRWVGFATGGMYIVFAFFPVLAAAFVLMPTPVKGAILIYVACFTIVLGLQLITTRMMDTRKILVVGGSIIAGLSAGFLPDLYRGLPISLQAIMSSPLSFATVVAVLLNLICRIGISRRATLALGPTDDRRDAVTQFMHRTGGAWGARTDVIRRATVALFELVDVAAPMAQAGDRIRINARFDEFYLDVYVLFGGPPLELPDVPPSPQAVAADPAQLRALSGYLIRAAASETRCTRRGDLNLLHLRFDH